MGIKEVCMCLPVVIAAVIGQASAQSTLLISDSNGDGGVGSGNKVVRFEYDTGTGAMVNYFASPIWSPTNNTTGIVQKADGNILVASYNSNSILEYDGVTGQYLGEFVAPGASGLITPNDLALGPNGNIWVSCEIGNKVIAFDGTTGAFVTQRTGIVAPRGLAFNPADGFLYVVESTANRVSRFRLDGQILLPQGIAVSGLLSSPQDVLFRSTGEMYVSNWGTNSIAKAQAIPSNPSPGQFQQFGSTSFFVIPNAFGLNRPIGMQLDADGAVLVTQRTDGEVLRFVPAGPNGPAVSSTVVVAGWTGGLRGGYGLLLYDPPQPPEPCAADMNDDGVLNFFDVSEFLSIFSSGCP